MSLQKAQLASETGDTIEFQYNPETVSFRTSAKWREQRTQIGEDGPVRQFEGTDPINLQLEMLLDAVEAGRSTVTDQINKLASWTNPTPESTSSTSPAPPELTFSWGEFQIGTSRTFTCHLQSVAVRFTLFRPSGQPVRARATVELISTTTVRFRQNPTSGGRFPHRVHVLQRGDRLSTIAAREYGDAACWRQIAAYNGIDDPLTLPIGQQILLPAARELGDA